MTNVVELFPQQPDDEPKRFPDCLCRTVGELLGSIAYEIEGGRYDSALRQARECAEAYADVPLPDLPEDDDA